MLLYPAILYPPDASGLSGCLVPDLVVNASGPSPDAAIEDAAGIMAEHLRDLAARGEPFPEPTPVAELDLDGGILVMLPAPLPRAA